MNKELWQFFYKIRVPIFIVGLMWLTKAYEALYEVRLTRWGIYPRSLDGLHGIITGPFVHGDIKHLMSNTFPMLSMLIVLFLFYRKIAVSSLVFLTVVTGILVWFFARSSYHIGASGVSYALVSFVMWTGIFRRNIKSIILALLVLMLYGGFIQGVIPTEEGISWESHLLGSLTGVAFAYIFKDIRESDEEVEPFEWEKIPERPFFPSDIFEKTRLQRYLEEQERLRLEALARAQEQMSRDSFFGD